MKRISYQELLIEVHEVYELLHKLTKSDIRITSYISTSLIPYLSFVCDSLDYFHQGTNKVHSSLYKDIKETSVQKIIKENRSTLKLYSDYKKNKVIAKLEDDTTLFNNYLTNEYNLMQKLVKKILGQRDLGIYAFREIEYANTYQLFKNSKSLFTINHEFRGSVMEEFARCLPIIFPIRLYIP